MTIRKISEQENLIHFDHDLTVAAAHELALLGGYLAASGGWLFPSHVTRHQINQVLSKWLEIA